MQCSHLYAEGLTVLLVTGLNNACEPRNYRGVHKIYIMALKRKASFSMNPS